MTGNFVLWIVFAVIAMVAVREILLFTRWNNNLRRKREECVTLLRQQRYSVDLTHKTGS
jgi:hypothetical protein